MAERVLVTGGTGFVGARVVEALLAAGHEVVTTARRPAAGPARHIACDLLDPSDMAAMLAEARATMLVHCAWYVAHGAFWEATENEEWRHASAALFARFYEAVGRHVVGLGSCAEYDWTDDGAASWTEQRALAPASAYGRAKLAAAADLAKLAERHGRAATWARLFFLFGPGEDPRRLVPSMLSALQAGRAASLAHPDLVRDYCSTWHAGTALARLCEARHPPTHVNVASGRGVTLRTLAQSVAAALGVSPVLACPDPPDPLPAPRRIVAEVSTIARATHLPAADLPRDLSRLVRLSAAERASATAGLVGSARDISS